MTDHLRRALADAGDEVVERVRVLLESAGVKALDAGHPAALVYAGLSGAVLRAEQVDGVTPDPFLRASVSVAPPDVVRAVVAEIAATAGEERDVSESALLRVLCQEVVVAVNEAAMAMADAHVDLAATDHVPEDW